MESHKELMTAYLCESLRELMVRSLFEKITIKQICDRAGVIRATFYNYFDDKYDCLYQTVLQDISYSGEESPEQMIRRVLSNIESHRDFYRVAYNVTGQNSFDAMVHRALTEVLSAYMKEHRNVQVLEDYDNDFLSRYFAECVAFDVREFVFRKDESLSVDRMTRMVIELTRSSLVDVLG